NPKPNEKEDAPVKDRKSLSKKKRKEKATVDDAVTCVVEEQHSPKRGRRRRDRTREQTKEITSYKGPLEQTVNEFWHMVLQEEAETIIMLCNCIETGKYKCHPYWPDKTGEMKQFNGVEVYNVQTRVLSPEELTVMVCILNVKFAKPDGSMDAREVRHYQWMDWPDRGVPPLKLTSMERAHEMSSASCHNTASTPPPYKED
ncbi:Protein-tyrosine phosphatase, partial [Teladorsagia circumcincta]